jgi:RHS repeat-associated protein
VDSFTYTVTGQLAPARNQDAWVTRTYYPNGALHTEQQEIFNEARTARPNSYLLRYTYDLDGRRRSLHLPAALMGGTSDSLAWTYEPETGALATAVAPQGAPFQYAYTMRGDVAALTLPGAYQERYGYDADGQLTDDTLKNTGALTGGRYPALYARLLHLRYDARGKQLQSQEPIGLQQQTLSTYTGLGALATHWSSELQDPGSGIRNITGEVQQYDALGNIVAGTLVDSTWDIINYATPTVHDIQPRQTVTYAAKTGRLVAESGVGFGDKAYRYDPAGNLVLASRLVDAANGIGEDRMSYYNAQGQVVAADGRDWPTALNQWKVVWETYRYDALGRRVAVRTWREQHDYQGQEKLVYSLNTLRRTVWDGNQEVMEIQVPGGASESDATLYDDDYTPNFLSTSNTDFEDLNPFFGRVVYTHGLGLDQPVAVTRYRYVNHPAGQSKVAYGPMTYSLLWTPQGRLTLALCTTGQVYCWNNAVPTDGMILDRPEALSAYNRAAFFVPRAFQGSLLEDKQDGAGTLYRRNRVYDPASGRFTQEDPIGLAGGMNLYGFAGGDPVNNSDPFGLCFWDACIAEGYTTAMMAAGLATIVTAAYIDMTNKFGSPSTWFSSGGSEASGSEAKGPPKSSPNFVPPTNPPQDPPTELPEGHTVRVMPPTQDYPNGYWVQTNPRGQPVNPATGKPPGNVTRPEGRAQTHVPRPPSKPNTP